MLSYFMKKGLKPARKPELALTPQDDFRILVRHYYCFIIIHRSARYYKAHRRYVTALMMRIREITQVHFVIEYKDYIRN